MALDAVGERQRRHLHNSLAVDPQGLATRAQDLQVGTRTKQAVGEDRGGIGEVLAVVEDEEQSPVARKSVSVLTSQRADASRSPRAPATVSARRAGS